MLVVISPAKRLDWSERDVRTTQPDFEPDAVRLARTARNLSLRDLKGLMALSDDLARLNRDRFRAFSDTPVSTNTRPAAFAFAGDTYQGLMVEDLDESALHWAQDHLRILSGLYGILRPLDAIQPYRLEMGSRLKTRRGSNLYEYWRDQLSKSLNSQAGVTGSDVLVNCASQEYFGAVDLKSLKLEVVTPQFMEDKGNGPKIVSFFAKKARGAMARFIVENRFTRRDGVLNFDWQGYAYRPDLSTDAKPVFVRSYPA